LVLYLQSQFKTKSLGLLYSSLQQAAKVPEQVQFL
jgi:hypothetical protein